MGFRNPENPKKEKPLCPPESGGMERNNVPIKDFSGRPALDYTSA